MKYSWTGRQHRWEVMNGAPLWQLKCVTCGLRAYRWYGPRGGKHWTYVAGGKAIDDDMPPCSPQQQEATP